MKSWVDVGATQWFWTRDLWIGNKAAQPLGTAGTAGTVEDCDEDRR